MAGKNFQKAPKPKNQVSPDDIEAYENGGMGHDKNPQTHKPTNVGIANNGKLKRLSLDIPESVHLRFKTACSATGRKMTKEIEALILKRCKELEKISK